MSENNEAKNEYVTAKDLEGQLGEQTKVIISAVDSMLTKHKEEVNKKLDEMKDELKADINNVQTLIDGYVKAQEDFKQEFIIMKEEFRQMKQIIKDKLGIEVRAI